MTGGTADRNPPAEKVPAHRTQDIIPVERTMSGRDATPVTVAAIRASRTERERAAARATVKARRIDDRRRAYREELARPLDADHDHGDRPRAPWIAATDLFTPATVAMYEAGRTAARIASGPSWVEVYERRGDHERPTRGRQVLASMEASVRAHAATTQARRRSWS